MGHARNRSCLFHLDHGRDFLFTRTAGRFNLKCVMNRGLALFVMLSKTRSIGPIHFLILLRKRMGTGEENRDIWRSDHAPPHSSLKVLFELAKVGGASTRRTARGRNLNPCETLTLSIQSNQLVMRGDAD